MAAVLACGEGAALSHFSAAVLWGLMEDPGGPIHVTVEGNRVCRGVVVHRSPLQGARVRRAGIVVTTVGRTLIDLADVVTKRRTLERAFDEAEYLGLDWEGAAPIQGRRGSGLIASVLAVHEPGTTRTLSELEEHFLAFCERHDFPRPEVNVSIEGYLCDFVWREQRVIVETDGRRAHGTMRARRRDPDQGRRPPDSRVARDAHHLDAVVRRARAGEGSARAPACYAGACNARRTASTVTIPRSTPSRSTAMMAPNRARPSWVSRLSSGSSS